MASNSESSCDRLRFVLPRPCCVRDESGELSVEACGGIANILRSTSSMLPKRAEMRLTPEQLAESISNVKQFRHMDASDIRLMTTACTQRSFKTGETLTHQGFFGNASYIILDGIAGVIVDGKRVGTMSKGDLVGEKCLIFELPEDATVIADTPMIVISMLYQKVLENGLGSKMKSPGNPSLPEKKPQTPQGKTELDRQAIVETLQANPNLTLALRVNKKMAEILPLSEEQWDLFVDRCSERQTKAGEVIITQGDESDNVTFYMVKSGLFQARVLDGNGEELFCGQIEENGSFGELALIYNAPRAATVKSVTNGSLWTIDRSNFQKTVSEIADAVSIERQSVFRASIAEESRLTEAQSGGCMSVCKYLRMWEKSKLASLFDRVAQGIGSRASTSMRLGCLEMNVLHARSLPRPNFASSSGFCILLEVFEGEDVENGRRLAAAISPIAEAEITNKRASAKVEWHTVLHLPSAGGAMASKSDILPAEWDIRKAHMKFSLCDLPKNGTGGLRGIFRRPQPKLAGWVAMPVAEVVSKDALWLNIFDKNGDAICADDGKYRPCKLHVSCGRETIPANWYLPPPKYRTYPYHIFMMTRGTRGDVQPFVALARGMAEMLGWLVTICTEMRWKSFVLQHSNVSSGKIQFMPSGGDTEAQMSDPVSQFVTMAKSEMFQMLIMANSEANFFPSTTVFLDHIDHFETVENTPVDVIVFGLTVAGIALMIGELMQKPIIGFVLQPTCIPSNEKTWSAVQKIQTKSLGLVDDMEEYMFTGHGTLNTMKAVFENSVFDKWSLNAMRKKKGLAPANTYEELKKYNIPVIIPMKEDTFPRPADWWSNIILTDFIFLRMGAQGKRPSKTSGVEKADSLGEPLTSFIKAAKGAGDKIGLMTFSSMMVPRAIVLKLCIQMVTQCRFKLRMVYVGKKWPGDIPVDIQREADELISKGSLLLLEKADFGELFKYPDCFIIQGGLGTTVEAGRVKKPIVVSGPLLLDQRFWGEVCFKKGVGPAPTHIDGFHKIAVEFVDNALDPSDPKGWQAKAREADWGEVEDDGIRQNVKAFQAFITNGSRTRDPSGEGTLQRWQSLDDFRDFIAMHPADTS